MQVLDAKLTQFQVDQADDIEGVDGIELPAIPEKGDVTGLLRNFQNNQNKK